MPPSVRALMLPPLEQVQTLQPYAVNWQVYLAILEVWLAEYASTSSSSSARTSFSIFPCPWCLPWRDQPGSHAQHLGCHWLLRPLAPVIRLVFHYLPICLHGYTHVPADLVDAAPVQGYWVTVVFPIPPPLIVFQICIWEQ